MGADCEYLCTYMCVGSALGTKRNPKYMQKKAYKYLFKCIFTYHLRCLCYAHRYFVFNYYTTNTIRLDDVVWLWVVRVNLRLPQSTNNNTHR